MIATIGSWVYVLSTALIVVALIELLAPRSAATGLVGVIVGLCVIALLLDIALNLVSDGLDFEFEIGPPDVSEATVGRHYASTGEALAAGTLAVVQSALGDVESQIEPPIVMPAREPRGTGSLTRVDEVSIAAIADVKVGGWRD